jgi:hypothetical protein
VTFGPSPVLFDSPRAAGSASATAHVTKRIAESLRTNRLPRISINPYAGKHAAHSEISEFLQRIEIGKRTHFLVMARFGTGAGDATLQALLRVG